MSRVLCMGVIALSERAIDTMNVHNIFSLQELMVWRDRGFLALENFDEETLKELQDACEEIDRFNDTIRKRIISIKNEHVDKDGQDVDIQLLNEQVGRGIINDGSRRVRESILKDLVSISSLGTPTSLRKAILKLMIDNPNKGFDRKMIKKALESKYKDTISVNTDTLRSLLSSLESHMFIRRINSTSCYKITKYALNEFSKSPNSSNYYKENREMKLSNEKELRSFIDNNLGQEIEFRYKSKRAGSDKWWRRVKVYEQDDSYLYTTDYYPSGGRMRYLKEGIVEYRMIDDEKL